MERETVSVLRVISRGWSSRWLISRIVTTDDDHGSRVDRAFDPS